MTTERRTLELLRVVLLAPNATAILGPVWIFRKKL